MEPAVLDVRPLIRRERHPKIFEAFERLKTGEAFILDPAPLRRACSTSSSAGT